MKQELKEIPINQITVEENYRQTFDEKGLAGLTRSIKKNGVIQPVVVRPKGKGYVLVAGERRLRASKDAGKVTIPAVIRELTDHVDIIELQLIENIQKEAVPYMEEAYGLAKLREKGTLDVKEIADRIGKSDQYVYAMLKIAAMSPDARNIAEKGWITKAVAWEIAKLKDEDQQTQAANALARTKKEKQISVGGAKQYIADIFGGDTDNALRKSRIAKFGPKSHADFAANWKHHLVRFTAEQFETFKTIVRGRTETAVLAEAVDCVMREEGSTLVRVKAASATANDKSLEEML
jgi:ParB family transcriptional regulator, chromosome partitioning protein